MGILWVGGEDIDFPNGSTPGVDTGLTARRRSAYSRCSLTIPAGADVISYNFPGGAITSCWFSAYVCGSTAFSLARFLGLGQSGAGGKGLFIGQKSSAGQIALYKWDGASATELAAEAGTSIPSYVLTKVDIHVENYGASATVNVYINGASSPIITYNGDITVSGVTGYDRVIFHAGSTAVVWHMSETIVSTEDTRTLSLATLAPSGIGGCTDEWTGAFTDVNEITLNDATVNYVDLADKVQQFELTDLTAGAFMIQALMLVARATKTADATPQQLKLGFVSGGSPSDGSAQALTTSWVPYCRLMLTNPLTGVVFSTSEINALLLQLKSAA